MPRIFGQNIMLREYSKEDLPHMREWVNDPEIVNNLSDIFLYPTTVNSTESFLNSVLEAQANDQAHFIIADISTGSYIGQIDLIKIDWKNRSAEMGIVIGKKDCLSKGIGTEAIQLLQNFVFERMNLNRLYLSVRDSNDRAKACYLKCGFVEEGRKRQDFYIDGRYTDTIIMSVLKSEYENIYG